MPHEKKQQEQDPIEDLINQVDDTICSNCDGSGDDHGHLCKTCGGKGTR